jgi:hypothetical protein
MDYYAEAATALAEYINGYGFPLHRDIPLRKHKWWYNLSGAAYTLIETKFRQKEIIVSLNPAELDLLRRRAISRGSTIRDLSHEEIILYDIIDMLEYYNDTWPNNPPLGYQIPTSFYL